MQRDQKLLELRPVLELITENSLPEEHFTNTKLWPIAKLQHSLIISFFTHYLQEKSIPFSSMNAFKQRLTIENALKRDLPLRHTLIGFVLGQLTTEEFTVFLSNRLSLQKRLTTLLIQRIADTLIQPDSIA